MIVSVEKLRGGHRGQDRRFIADLRQTAQRGDLLAMEFLLGKAGLAEDVGKDVQCLGQVPLQREQPHAGRIPIGGDRQAGPHAAQFRGNLLGRAFGRAFIPDRGRHFRKPRRAVGRRWRGRRGKRRAD